MIDMERKIGEIFEFGGEWYQCINTGNCSECAFTGKRCYDFSTKGGDIIGDCTGRTFKKLEKVGEPVTEKGKTFQKLISNDSSCKGCVFCNENDGCDECCYMDEPCLGNEIWIEIKQTKEDMGDNDDIRPYDELFSPGTVSNTKYLAKEDMEEKNNGNTPLNVLTDKYVNGDICYDDFEKEVKALYSCKEETKPNLKEFDLEAAKAGKPVCTRDGRKARIICFDAKDTQPIIGLYEKNIDGIIREYLCSYHTDGRMYDDQDTGYDLMMLPEKRIGWININKDAGLFKSKEEAERDCTKDYATVRVEFEI